MLAVILVLVAVILLGLPIMAGYTLSQAAQSSRGGDDAMARSWADAARSFGGMTVASWLFLLVGWWGYGLAMQLLNEIQTGNR